MALYFVVCYFTGIHQEIVLEIKSFLNYALPVLVAGNLQYASANNDGNVTGWVHSNGGNNNGNGDGGPGRRPSQISLDSTPNPWYTYDPIKDIFTVNDPHSVLSNTLGIFNPNTNYPNDVVWGNMAKFLHAHAEDSRIPYRLNP